MGKFKETALMILKHLILLMVGGFTYIIIELIWRGRTHWTMFFVGGLCFVLIGLINELFPWDMKLIYQAMIGSLIVTLNELVFGYIINIKLGWNVWDYSNLPFNIFGQICLPFSILWCGLSIVAIFVDDLLRYLWFGEEKPHYTL